MDDNQGKIRFKNIDIQKVNNGFIVEIDKRNCTATYPESIYVFNTLDELSKFIKELE